MTSTASPRPPAEPSLDGIIPFGDFLASLRERGMAVGVREYRSLERLLLRWPSTNRESLRDAIASVVARNEGELARAQEAFDAWFADDEQAPPPPEKKRAVPRKRVLVFGLVLLMLTGAAIGGVYWWRVEHNRAAAVPKEPPPGPMVTQGEEVPPPPPALPPPPFRQSLLLPAAGAAFLALLVLIVAAELRTRRRRAQWKRDYFDTSLAEASGPARYEPQVRREQPPIPRQWAEEVATIVGRGLDPDRTGNRLDVDESLRLTLRQGLHPHLAFEPPPRNAAILVLQDTASAMRPWRAKMSAFASELVRQGVLIERWFFDTDPAIVWTERHGRTVSLERLFSQSGEQSLLIISTGDGAEGLLAEDSPTAALLRRWKHRAWLNPIGNFAYWPAALTRVPMNVWPATRNGLRGMAWDLAPAAQAAPAELVDAPREVTSDDVERMKRLIAIVPSPTIALTDELRRRYAPDIPEEVALFLAAEGIFRGERYQLEPQEIVRLLNDERADAPSREKRVRRYLLEVLRASEPPEGSVAHLRWELDVAMQEMNVAAVEGTDTSPAMIAIGTLAEGPLRDEVERASGTFVAEKSLQLELRKTLRGAEARIPTAVPENVRELPPRVVWPGAIAAAIAAMIVAAPFVAGFPKSNVGGAAIPHVEDAYELTFDGKVFSAKRNRGDVPNVVKFFPSDGVRYQLPFQAVPGDRSVGRYYQIHAQMAEGNLAVSNPVWVPAVKPVPVPVVKQEEPPRNTEIVAPPPLPTTGSLMIKAARTLTADVRIFDAAGRRTGATQLQPGDYRIEIENPLYDFTTSAKVVAGESTTVDLSRVTAVRGMVTLTSSKAMPATIRLRKSSSEAQLTARDGEYVLLAPAGKYELELAFEKQGIDDVQTVTVVAGERRREGVAPPVRFAEKSAEISRVTNSYKVVERTTFTVRLPTERTVSFEKNQQLDYWMADGKKITFVTETRVSNVDGMILKLPPDSELFVPDEVTPAGSPVDDKTVLVRKDGGRWVVYGRIVN